MKTQYVQNNFLSGVLDPRARARVETDAYNNGLLVGTNITPIHLGGVRRRPGLRYLTKLSNKLTRITTGVTVTAPQGGTTANANDNDATTLVTTTNNVSTTNPFVVLHYDLGSTKAIQYVDIMNVRSSGGSSTEFTLQYSLNNTTWSFVPNLPDAADFLALVDTTPRSYRRGHPHTTFNARYLRFVKATATDMGAVTITTSGMNVWQDSGVVSECRAIPFEVSADEQYLLAITDYSGTVYRDGVQVSRIPLPYASDDLGGLDAANDAETMVIVHEDYPPYFILRESNTSTNYNIQPEQIVFENVPQLDFADALSPTPTSEVQVITFTGFTAGNVFQLELDGARTASIAYAGDSTAAEQAATAANIAREVQKLYTVQAYTGVSCARTGAGAYTVTFANASAGTYGLMSGIQTVASATIAVTRSAAGVPRREPLWSATRGYPRTVAFFEGRLYFGGVKSLQQAILGSEVNNILNFDTGAGLADEAIFTTLTGAHLNSLTGLYAGRSFECFTSGAEYRFAKQEGVPVVPGDTPKMQTANGAKKVRPRSLDGQTLFVQRTGKALRNFQFDYEQNAYDSLGVSSLAPHLINDIVDLDVWNGSRQDEIGLAFVVNGDGTLAVFNSRKEAQVQAWVKWTTEGLFKAVGVVFEDRYFIVQRTIAGVDGLYLEMADESYYADCSARSDSINNVGDGTSIALGAWEHLIDQEVRVRADGFTLSNATPNSPGNIVIDGGTWALVEAGLGFQVAATPMPLNTMTPLGPSFMGKQRIVKVWCMVRNTQGLVCNGKPLPDRYYDIDSFDQDAEPVTTVHALHETTNWDESEDKLIELTQDDLMPLEILGIKVQMEVSP